MNLDPSALVLLGAGASAEAGIPTAFALTDHLEERLLSRPDGAKLAATYRLVRDGLRRSTQYLGPIQPDIDVERVFAAVELLAERDTLEIAHFVERWHPLLRGSAGQIENFEALVDAIPLELRQLVVSAPGDGEYLAPLVEAGRRPGGLTIATLNYDLTIEQCAAARNVFWDTGMEGWVVYGVWMWQEEGVRLLKLHGSIGDAWDEPEHWKAFMPHQGIYGVDDPSRESRPPVLAFGRREKLRAAGPFVSILVELERMLRDVEQLIVIGYSFRDDHINEAIIRWSHFSTGRQLVVVDPSWPDHFDNSAAADFRATLYRCLVPPPSNPGLFKRRLEVRREPCSKALQALRV